MNSLTHRYLADLKACIDDDARILRLNESEARLTVDPALSPLWREKVEAEEGYVRCRGEFGEDDPMTLQAQKRLFEAKTALDYADSAKEYMESYREVSALYRQIDDILFRDFRQAKKGCRHD